MFKYCFYSGADFNVFVETTLEACRFGDAIELFSRGKASIYEYLWEKKNGSSRFLGAVMALP